MIPKEMVGLLPINTPYYQPSVFQMGGGGTMGDTVPGLEPWPLPASLPILVSNCHCGARDIQLKGSNDEELRLGSCNLPLERLMKICGPFPPAVLLRQTAGPTDLHLLFSR